MKYLLLAIAACAVVLGSYTAHEAYMHAQHDNFKTWMYVFATIYAIIIAVCIITFKIINNKS